MSSKINIFDIIEAHISTLKNYNKVLEYNKDPDNKNRFYVYNKWDFVIFFVLPLILGIFFVYFDLLPIKEILTVLVTSLSVFTALLFNLLLLAFDIMRKPTTNPTRKIFLEEIYANVSFCILIAITTISMSVLSIIFLGNCIIYHILSFFVYYFSILFILTLLMVLKRIYALISTENND